MGQIQKEDETMANVERLEDRYHNCVGYMHVEGNGDKKLEDRYHNVLGYYHKSSNRTEDRYHAVVGYGDILTSLLHF